MLLLLRVIKPNIVKPNPQPYVVNGGELYSKEEIASHNRTICWLAIATWRIAVDSSLNRKPWPSLSLKLPQQRATTAQQLFSSSKVLSPKTIFFYSLGRTKEYLETWNRTLREKKWRKWAPGIELSEHLRALDQLFSI